MVEILRGGKFQISDSKFQENAAKRQTDNALQTSNFKRQTDNFDIATLAKCIDNQEDIENPNIVKVVFDAMGKAVYFSRSPIPFLRNIDRKDWAKSGQFFKHIGLYAYKTNVLLDLAQLSPSNLEKLESLEQLRWLENGYAIGVAQTNLETIGIDTPEDLEKIKN